MGLSNVAVRILGALAAAAMLTSCGGEQMQSRVDPATRSWMEPDAYKHTLIYAGGDQASYVFTFPAGKLVGTIAETSFGTCSDSNGDVFFTQVKSIVEYPHGGSAPIATFAVAGSAYSCSVDPRTGNLAAVVFCFSECGDEVVILRAPGHPPKTYQVPGLKSLLYCAYDDEGDLFVDGYNGARFGLWELPKGVGAFTNVKLKQKIDFGAQIQWDGEDLAVETRIEPAIDRVQISGTTGKIVGTTSLSGVGDRATQSWISGGKIAVPTAPGSKRAVNILFWHYPAGGNPTNAFQNFIGGGHQMIDGVTFSLAPRTSS